MQRREIGLAEVSSRLAAFGVTGVTDATPDLGAADVVDFAEAHRHGQLLQRVEILAPAKRILHDDDLDLEALSDWIATRHEQGRNRCAALCYRDAAVVSISCTARGRAAAG